MRFLVLGAATAMASAAPPVHKWDTLGTMTFFHACNESGLWSERALDTITKFPMVTIEKGQGFNAPCPPGFSKPCAEPKMSAQIAAIKKRNTTIAAVFYMNLVLDWYFYHMQDRVAAFPGWQLRASKTGEPIRVPGDTHFDPPKGGMPVFNHIDAGLREFWKETCINATLAGADGCFADSSDPDTHKTQTFLNASDEKAFEAGKIATMTALVEHFAGIPGQPFAGSTGVVIGKRPYQLGINAFQIEMFGPSDEQIQVLLAGVSQGYLVQAHVAIYDNASIYGCPAMEDAAAAFLVGAGDYSYFGTGPWISPDITDIELRWCPALFERPLGRPVANATKDATGIWRRSFASGTSVSFDTATNKGSILWS